jgi:hypothetical protein
MDKPYAIIICPNSAQEQKFCELSEAELSQEATAEDLLAFYQKHSDLNTLGLYRFQTMEELVAFQKGYEAGVGYLGDGVCVLALPKGDARSELLARFARAVDSMLDEMGNDPDWRNYWRDTVKDILQSEELPDEFGEALAIFIDRKCRED